MKFESKWELKKLGEILETLESGKRPKGGVSEYQDGIPSLGGEHISLDGTISLNNMKFVPEEYFKQANQGFLKDLDILICKDGALTGKTSLFVKNNFPYEKGMINEHVFLLRTNENSSQKYLFNVLFGYEFSNRRGSEGIHPIQRGKNIEDCTQLFDADIFDNPTKAINDRFTNPANPDYIRTNSADYEQARKIADEKISKLDAERKSSANEI